MHSSSASEFSSKILPESDHNPPHLLTTRMELRYLNKRTRPYWRQPEQLTLLRHGQRDQISKGQKSILTYEAIGKLVGLSASRVRQLIKKSNTLGDEQQPFSNRMHRNLEDYHIQFLICQQTLENWTPYSLAERCVLFHRKFPDKNISESYLWKLYKQNKIKRKKLYLQKCIPSSKLDDYTIQLAEIQSELTFLAQSGYKIIQIDEVVFSAKTQGNLAWRRPNDIFKVQDFRKQITTTAVVAGISVQGGLEAFLLNKNSIRSEQFMEFLTLLIGKNKDQKIALFLDNLSVHRSKISKKFAADKNLKLIYNVPYSPQFNGIELYWNLVKQKYKKALLEKLLAQDRIVSKQLVKASLISVDENAIKACALKGFDNLGLKNEFDYCQ